MEIALYRKYRPQAFGEVCGQDHIVSVLKNSVQSGDIAHSYLFCGSRGTGKTSIARILAREIGTTEEDLLEIDAASNRGIDDVRALRESVRSLPFRSLYKVYIIDEAHMLTKEAFNALLKTLEEPPRHVVFVLATTELQKLPETVVSRCEIHTFQKPSQAVLTKLIVDVVKKEGRTIDPSGAHLIALLGDGSFRDTLGVLQKVFRSENSTHITLEAIERVTHAPEHQSINGLITTVCERDLAKGLKVIQDVRNAEADFELFLKLFLKKMRAILLFRYAHDMRHTLREEYGKDELSFIEAHAADMSLNSETLKVFLDAYIETKRSYIPELPLELALIKLLGDDTGQ